MLRIFLLDVLGLFVTAISLSDGSAAGQNPLSKNAQGRRKKAAAQFAEADADQSGVLTVDELLAAHSELDPADRNRRFFVFDFDCNGELSKEEFRQLLAPTDERGEIPDPMVDLVNTAMMEWGNIIQAADGAGSGT